MAPPLAGKPPFATDEDDSVFQSSPQPRRRPAAPQKSQDTNSTYDVYDNYLAPGDNGAANRQSGIEGLGMGFMNAIGDDSDSSDDDEEDMRRTRLASSPKAPVSKQAALAAAIGASPSKSAAAFASPERFETPPPQYQQQKRPQQSSTDQKRQPQSPPPGPTIAAPRPGYAAPIAALNQMGDSVARPAPAAAPAGRNNNPNGLRIVAPNPNSPAANANAPPSPFGTSSPTSSPHPLQAPVTPITPVFARPQRTATMESNNSVAFSETKGLIMRGDREETLLARGRGEKGEQFWRRFSMVAKDPHEKGPSAWLKKNEGGARSHKRWIWIVGIILLICVAGGVGLGVYVSQQAASHYRPDTLGGSANEGTTVPTNAKSAVNSKSAGKGALGGASTGLHVAPTNTVARREPMPHITVAAGHARRNRHLARLEPEEAL